MISIEYSEILMDCIMAFGYQRWVCACVRERGQSMQEPTFVDLSEAHLCTDCEAVGDSAIRCPRCQSQALIAVCRAIHRHRDSIRILGDGYLEEPVLKAA